MTKKYHILWQNIKAKISPLDRLWPYGLRVWPYGLSFWLLLFIWAPLGTDLFSPLFIGLLWGGAVIGAALIFWGFKDILNAPLWLTHIGAVSAFLCLPCLMYFLAFGGPWWPDIFYLIIIALAYSQIMALIGGLNSPPDNSDNGSHNSPDNNLDT